MLKNNYMEDFVPFEIAKKLKEKGFNWPCSHYYRTKCKDLFMVFPSEDWSDIEERINAPTISQALKYLEKEKKVFIDTKTHIDLNGNYHFSYSIIFNGKQERQDYTFFDWERIDAYITAIDDALDNIII